MLKISFSSTSISLMIFKAISADAALFIEKEY